MLLSLLKILWGGLVLCAAAGAQDVSCKFRVFSWEADKPSTFTYLSKGQPVAVKNIRSDVRSEMLEYTGAPLLALYEDTSAAGAPEDRKTARPLARILLPGGIRHALILLYPNPQASGPPYAGLVFDDDPAAFPFGSYLFYNLSKSAVAVSVGDETFILARDEKQLFRPQQVTIHLQIATRGSESAEWERVYDKFFPSWPQERNLFFIMDRTCGSGTRVVDTRSLLENDLVWKQAGPPPPERETSDRNPLPHQPRKDSAL
jgi:hypothetical protein